MTEIINLENLYLFDGGTKDNWEFFCKDINNESHCKKIMFTIYNYLTTQPKNELTLDIIDYILDYGCPLILNMCTQKSFLDQIVNLLKPKTNAGLENQKKAIFLIQRCAKKFINDKNMIIFQEQYNMLKNSGVVFPPDNYVIKTYDKFTGERKDNINNNNIKQNELNNNNKNNNEVSQPNNEKQKDEFPPTQEEQKNEGEDCDINKLSDDIEEMMKNFDDINDDEQEKGEQDKDNIQNNKDSKDVKEESKENTNENIGETKNEENNANNNSETNKIDNNNNNETNNRI